MIFYISADSTIIDKAVAMDPMKSEWIDIQLLLVTSLKTVANGWASFDTLV